MAYKINDTKLVIRTKNVIENSTESRVSYLLALVDFEYLYQNYSEAVEISDIVSVTLTNGMPSEVKKTDLSSINKELIDEKIKSAIEERVKVINFENQERNILSTARNTDFGYKLDI